MNLPLRLFVSVGLFVIASFLPVCAESFNSAYISEVLSENRRGIKDDDGDRSPWIELYNGSGATISLNPGIGNAWSGTYVAMPNVSGTTQTYRVSARATDSSGNRSFAISLGAFAVSH